MIDSYSFKNVKLFNEGDLRDSTNKLFQSMEKEIDDLSNEEIMANDLDILANNFYEKFKITLPVIGDEEIDLASVKQQKIQKRSNFYADPFSRNGRCGYREVDGIVLQFYFPYVGDSLVFRRRASSFSLSSYPNITIDEDERLICFTRSESFSDIDDVLALQKKVRESITKDLESIRAGIRSSPNLCVNSL